MVVRSAFSAAVLHLEACHPLEQPGLAASLRPGIQWSTEAALARGCGTVQHNAASDQHQVMLILHPSSASTWEDLMWLVPQGQTLAWAWRTCGM